MNMSPALRDLVRERLEQPLRDALAAGADAVELAQLVAQQLPLLVDQPLAVSCVLEAYGRAPGRELTTALPFDTGPLEKPDAID